MKTLIPFFIAASAFADQTIQWDASNGATKYYLYEVLGGGPFKIAETTGLDSQVITTTAGVHTYSISSVNSQGEGPRCPVFSVTVTALPTAKPVPLAPANIKVK